MKTLIVVDMQKDFIDGALGSEQAVQIVSNVKNKIEQYLKNGDNVFFTLDTHTADYMNTREGKFLPVPHCIKGEKGWRIPKELLTYEDGIEHDFQFIQKPSFGYTEWEKYINEKTESVELCGLCTDICVVSNALIIKNAFPEMDIIVDASCCAGVTPESHDAAILTMKSCQILIENEGKEPWREK